MFRRGDISTETDKKPFIFAVICFSIGLAVTIAAFLLAHGNALSIFAGVMMGVVTLAAGVVLFAMISDCAYVSDNKLHMNYLFKKNAIEVAKIGRVSLKDNVYTVYDRAGNVVGTINGLLTGVDTILYCLDKNGIKIGEN